MNNHKMFCKHRPNDDCTHYQEGAVGDIFYLKFKDQEWYCWNTNKQWEQVEDWFVRFLIDNPTPIDFEIKRERKYNWWTVPENIKWIATNEGGVAFGYEGKPISGYLHSGFWYGGGEPFLTYMATVAASGENLEDVNACAEYYLSKTIVAYTKLNDLNLDDYGYVVKPIRLQERE